MRLAYNKAVLDNGDIVELNLHDSGFIMGTRPATLKVCKSKEEVRQYLYAVFTDNSIKGVKAALKEAMSLDGYSFELDGSLDQSFVIERLKLLGDIRPQARERIKIYG